jgi:hypothetical protein
LDENCHDRQQNAPGRSNGAGEESHRGGSLHSGEGGAKAVVGGRAALD